MGHKPLQGQMVAGIDHCRLASGRDKPLPAHGGRDKPLPGRTYVRVRGHTLSSADMSLRSLLDQARPETREHAELHRNTQVGNKPWPREGRRR